MSAPAGEQLDPAAPAGPYITRLPFLPGAPQEGRLSLR